MSGPTIKIPRPKGEFLSVRKAEWNNRRRVDVRNFYYTEGGEEKPGKGCAVYNQGELDKVIAQLQKFRDYLPAE